MRRLILSEVEHKIERESARMSSMRMRSTSCAPSAEGEAVRSLLQWPKDGPNNELRESVSRPQNCTCNCDRLHVFCVSVPNTLVSQRLCCSANCNAAPTPRCSLESSLCVLSFCWRCFDECVYALGHVVYILPVEAERQVEVGRRKAEERKQASEARAARRGEESSE